MKIAFCNNNIGGFYDFRKDVVEHFFNKGYEVILLFPRSKDNTTKRRDLSKHCRCIPVTMEPNGYNFFIDFRTFFQILRIYRNEKPDIVFNYTVKPNIYSSLAAKCLGIPVISMMAGLGYIFDGESFKKKLARWFYKIGLNASSRVIVLNQDNYNFLAARFIDRNKLILFEGGEGVNMQMYPYNENKFDEIHFLMIARIMYDKGYRQFVDAAKIVKQRFPNVYFELLGGLSPDSPTGVPVDVVQRDVADGYIDYLGESLDVPSIVLRDGVVVVVASYYMEGMNRALMEACSMGRPIITTNMPGCKELVDDGKTGFCVEPRDSQALADACIAFISLKQNEKEAMSLASFRKCKMSFDVKYVLQKYDKIVEDFL